MATEKQDKEELALAASNEKPKATINYISNNDTVVVKCLKEVKSVAVLVDGEKWGVAEPINGIAHVTLKKSLPETYVLAIEY